MEQRSVQLVGLYTKIQSWRRKKKKKKDEHSSKVIYRLVADQYRTVEATSSRSLQSLTRLQAVPKLQDRSVTRTTIQLSPSLLPLPYALRQLGRNTSVFQRRKTSASEATPVLQTLKSLRTTLNLTKIGCLSLRENLVLTTAVAPILVMLRVSRVATMGI